MSYFESIFHEEVIYEDKADIKDHIQRREYIDKQSYRHDKYRPTKKDMESHEKSISKNNSEDPKTSGNFRKLRAEENKEKQEKHESVFMDFDLD